MRLLGIMPIYVVLLLTTASWDHHFTDNIVRLGLNYRWGGIPVVAKY